MSGSQEALSALLALIRAKHVEVMDDSYDHLNGFSEFRFCEGCGTDLDEEPCPYLAAADQITEGEQTVNQNQATEGEKR